MLKDRLAFACLLPLFLVTPVTAGPSSVLMMGDWCRETDNGAASGIRQSMGWWCLGYVAGIAEGLEASGTICFGDDVRDRLHEVAKGALLGARELGDAYPVIAEALTAKFPC